MREIKFRAWDMVNKILMEPRYFGIDEYITPEGGVVEKETHSGIGFSDMYMVDISDNRILMQYTGLKDKNGVGIYEGDIVLYNRNIGKTIDKYKYVVKYSIDKYILDHDFSEIENDISWDMVEVIGNIYENPELLAGDTN